jgi:uridine kinase
MPTSLKTMGRAKIRISDVNREVLADSSAFFNFCNQNYENKITDIAHRIAADTSKSRLIMLSGPSASGKTTTSIKLQLALQKLGIGAVSISMDDFFKNREDTLVLPDGTRDYESLDSLDIQSLRDTLNELIEKGSTELPVFDFKSGRRTEKTRHVELQAGHVAVVEGLHALDTGVTGLFPSESTLKLYVSVSSDFVDDSGTPVLCARDIRLIRRTVRDFHFRGSNPDVTLGMWEAVCRGEDLYVRPFKKYADVTVNSAFACGPSIFCIKSEHLFSEATKSGNHRQLAKHIFDGLAAFEGMPESLMPGSCLLREFWGGSDYYNKSGDRR